MEHDILYAGDAMYNRDQCVLCNGPRITYLYGVCLSCIHRLINEALAAKGSNDPSILSSR